MKISVELSISSRHSFSISHALTASHLAEQASLQEAALIGPWNQALAGHTQLPNTNDHRASVTSAVIMSAAFLEATINEFFVDCDDGAARVSTLDPSRVGLASQLWKLQIPRTAAFRILEKYEVALAVFGVAALDRGAEPYQSANDVVLVRNDLVHAEPAESTTHSTIPSVPVTQHRFETRLRNRFAQNPLTGPGNAFFPEKMLSAGCARWAFLSSIAFADAFFSRLGLAPPYERVRPQFIR